VSRSKKKSKVTITTRPKSKSEETRHPYDVPLPGWTYKNKKVKGQNTNHWVTPTGLVLVTKTSVNKYLKEKGESFQLPEGRLVRRRRKSSPYFIAKNKSPSVSSSSSEESSSEESSSEEEYSEESSSEESSSEEFNKKPATKKSSVTKKKSKKPEKKTSPKKTPNRRTTRNKSTPNKSTPNKSTPKKSTPSKEKVSKNINLRVVSTEDLVDEDGWLTWTEICFDIPLLG